MTRFLGRIIMENYKKYTKYVGYFCKKICSIFLFFVTNAFYLNLPQFVESSPTGVLNNL